MPLNPEQKQELEQKIRAFVGRAIGPPRTGRDAVNGAYASPVSLPKPSQGSLPARAGSPLAGRVSHPLDDESKFHGVIASSNPNRPAEPGRTVFPILILIAPPGDINHGSYGAGRTQVKDE
jgi:hypothetical protein